MEKAEDHKISINKELGEVNAKLYRNKLHPAIYLDGELRKVCSGTFSLWNHSFTFFSEEDVNNYAGEVIENPELVTSCTTYHTYIYYGFFKPTMGEIFAQLSEEVKNSNEELYYTTAYILKNINGYHVGCTSFYRVKPFIDLTNNC